MDYVPGQQLADCWDEMGVPAKTRMAKDLARAMADMFELTASHCGVLLSLNDSQRSLRHELSAVDGSSVDEPASMEAYTEVVDSDFLIGPVDDIPFL